MGKLTTQKHDDSLVVAIRDQAMTDSLKVAEFFGKQHRNVLQAIERLDCPEEFGQLNFQQSFYVNEQNKKQPMYHMTKDGFTFLAMGFRGKKAAEFKVKYISAFNRMEKIINQRHNSAWIEQRNAGKVVRRELTDTIQEFIEYAEGQGSKNARHYYSNLTNMTYKALFLVGSASPQPFRDMLAIMEHSCLHICEAICRNAITDGMQQGLHYKEIYQLAKSRVEVLAGSLREQKLLGAA